MVDAVDSKSTSSNRVQVRVLSPAKNLIFAGDATRLRGLRQGSKTQTMFLRGKNR